MCELKKIAHVMRRFSLDKWGGTETVVFQACQQLRKLGIETGIFCTDILSRPGKEWVDNIPVHRHRYVFPWLFLDDEAKRKMQLKGGSPLSLSLFFSLLLEQNLSVIHTHVQHRLGGIARTVALLRGIPYVVSIHGGYYTIPSHHLKKMTEPFKNRLEWGKAFGWLLGARKTLQDADAIVCVGKDEAEQVRLRHPGKRVEYIPNGVDINKFKGSNGELFRESQGIRRNEKLILCVSRIDYQKNQLLLVRAFADFVRNHPDYRLVLIGPVNVEEYLQTIQSEAQALGIAEKLTFIPGYSPDDPLLVSAYRAADMFVLPSRTEPFGIVILEAWASGIPVIASNVGGIPGFTHEGQDILLFPDNDQEALTAHLERLASSSDLTQRLAACGSQTVRDYSWKKMGQRMVCLYEELISNNKQEKKKDGRPYK